MYIRARHENMGPKLKLICRLKLRRKVGAGVRKGMILFGAPKGEEGDAHGDGKADVWGMCVCQAVFNGHRAGLARVLH